MAWTSSLIDEIESEMDALSPSPWERMQLNPRRVRRPYGDKSSSKADLKRVAQREYNRRYAASEKGRAAIEAYAKSSAGRESQRRRDARRKGRVRDAGATRSRDGDHPARSDKTARP